MSQVKFKIGIFVPLAACDCVYSHFLDKVTSLIIPHKNEIDFEVKDANSREGYKLNIITNSVVVYNYPDMDKTLILKSILDFEKFMNKTFPPP